MVVLRSNAGDPPLFCVTGAGASAISLRLLSAAMAGRNFAAIQPWGLEERAMPDHSVAAAARRNVAAMRAVQMHGPYTIAGFSYGGVVAFEMACQLRAAGEGVARLVILDADAPLAAPSLGRRVRSRARKLQASAPESSVSRAAVVLGRAARFAVAYTKERVALTSAGWLPRRGLRQYELFFLLNFHMSSGYTPSSTFDGPTLVVRGDASDGISTGTDEPPTRPQHVLADLGWSTLVSGPVTTVEVPADHMSLLRKPAVDLVAAHIATALEDAVTPRPGRTATGPAG